MTSRYFFYSPHQIAAAMPEVTYPAQTDENLTPDRDDFCIQLLDGPALDGYFDYSSGDRPTATLEFVSVLDEEMRGHGIGARLVSSFFKLCEENNAEVAHSDVINPIALRIESRLVGGRQNLHIMQNVLGEEVELPITLDQACMSLERANKAFDEYEKNNQPIPRTFEAGLDVQVNMRDVDCSDWVLPVPVPVFESSGSYLDLQTV